METVCLDAVIGADGKVRLEVPCHLPPGPVKVVVVLGSAEADAPERTLRAGSFYGAAKDVRWSDLSGLGKEIWAGVDAQEYVNQLRDEWER